LPKIIGRRDGSIYLSINHTVLFIMNLLIYIQVPNNKPKNILITTCIWIKGTHGKNIISSQKWTIVTYIYPNLNTFLNLKTKSFQTPFYLLTYCFITQRSLLTLIPWRCNHA
jgi:hypothetical protein